MDEFVVGDVWYGKAGSIYQNVKATILRVTKDQVQILFDRKVNKSYGRVFKKANFQKLFEKPRKNVQMDMFTDRW